MDGLTPPAGMPPTPPGAGGMPPGPGMAGPRPSPMAGPTPNKGNKQLGMVNVESAMQLMEQALPHLGSSSPEGSAVLKAMTALSKHFSRQAAAPLVPAQLAGLQAAQAQSPISQMLQQRAGAGASPTPPPA